MVVVYAAVREEAPGAGHAVREVGSLDAPKPRLLDRVRAALRTRHYSRRAEDAYVAWIKRYIVFHGKRHPAEMGAPEVTRFLTSLAVDGHVAASTQNQALSALLFLYRDVREVDLPWLDGVVRRRAPGRIAKRASPSHLAELVRHAPARGWPRHPNRPGTGVNTTMIYTHALNRGPAAVQSPGPADRMFSL